MKKRFINSLLGIFFALLYTTASGQVSMARGRSVDEISSQTECVSKKDPGSIKHNERGHDVLRNFEESISNARSYESSYGFVVKFNVGGVNYRVDLDKKGNWLGTIRSYEEMKLPVDIRGLINSLYKGYSISFVQEIELPFQPLTFVVNLDGKNDIIQVRISGDEMEECQRLNKPHSNSFTSNNRN